MSVASVEECEKALNTLADRLAGVDAETRRKKALDRTLSCRLPDIGVIFGGRLHDGLLTDIRRVETADAQVKLTMSSDVLVSLMTGEQKFAGAWAAGRIKVDARVFDLLKLRTVF